MRSCLGRAVVAVVLLAGIGAAAWIWGPEVAPRLASTVGLGGPEGAGTPAVGPETARRAESRLRAFLEDGDEERIAFSSTEVGSVARERLRDRLPPAVLDPRLALEDDRVVVDFRVPRDAVAGALEGNRLLRFVPDTIPVRAEATVVPASGGTATLVIRRVEAARLPLPEAVIRGLLDLAGPPLEGASPEAGPSGAGDDEPSPPAIRLPLPEGIAAAYVLSDSLHLVADR